MKHLVWCLTMLVALFIVNWQVEAEPVLNPANGHYYDAITERNNWFDAKEAAESLTFEGRQGHLATITSAEENQFIADHLAQAIVGNYWLGGFQPPGNPEPDGGFQWVTQEPFIYTNWLRGQPDNNFDGEDALHLINSNGEWNDLPRTRLLGYVVEFSISPDISVVPNPAISAQQKIYWTDRATEKIQRADLDGQNIEDLVTGLSLPQGIALDPANSKMYWAAFFPKIQRADLDGSNVEELVTTGAVFPRGIALDLAHGKMYWTDPNEDEIKRADLDGSNIESVGGGPGPWGIAIDPIDRKMYWTDMASTEPKIRRANLDGSNVETILTEVRLLQPLGIAIDPVDRKMYWVDRGTRRIHRADLDGQNIEDIVTGLDRPCGIALDPTNGKVYWTDQGTRRIERADLDGQNIESVVGGLNTPEFIAVAVPDPLPLPPPWDVNEDGIVNIFDIVVVGQNFGQQPLQNPRADVNKDGQVNVFDLVLIGSHFGAVGF